MQLWHKNKIFPHGALRDCGQLVEDTYKQPDQQKKSGAALMRAVTATRRGVAVEQGLNQQVNKQVQVAQREQFVKQLDQWAQKTLQEFSHEGE